MDFYLVEADECDYDQYDEMLVAAANDEDAVALAVAHAANSLAAGKQVWTAKPLAMPTKASVILTSFNAG